jgi:predicted CXXCH cytochrome family protein
MYKPEKMPEGWQSGPGGAMLCITCHNCTSGICTLREESARLCLSCHDCTKGMACVLGIAHLGNSLGNTTRFQGCLSCHDGFIGKNAVAPGLTPGDHKVNVYYIKKKGYKSRPDRRIILSDGRVTCLSCHDPYKSEQKRLVMSNEGGRLCLSCHIK